MTADSNSGIAWHRVQLKKNRDAVKALEIAHFRMGHITGTNELAHKNIAILKRKIAESERYISAYERRTKRPVATDVRSLANVSSWSSWKARRVGMR
jgi:hypothetical protein